MGVRMQLKGSVTPGVHARWTEACRAQGVTVGAVLSAINPSSLPASVIAKAREIDSRTEAVRRSKQSQTAAKNRKAES